MRRSMGWRLWNSSSEPTLAQRRFQTSLLTGFSIVALLMAAVGIYGLIQYSIATRTQEIGLRMAIGAQAGDIFRMIIGEGLTLSLTGLALGLVGAWWLGRAGLESAVWRDRQRSVDVHDCLGVADGGCHCSLLFPSATRNGSGPRRGIACDLNPLGPRSVAIAMWARRRRRASVGIRCAF